MKKRTFFLLTICSLLMSGCKKEQNITAISSAPTVAQTVTVADTAIVEMTEATIPVETETKATEPQERWYHLSEWDSKLQMRCLVRNYSRDTITMQSAKVSYYMGDTLVEERTYDQTQLMKFLCHLESKLELTYGDGCVLLISDTEMNGKFNKAICEVFVTDSLGVESSQLFHFTMNESEVTPYSFEDREHWDLARSHDGGWNYTSLPQNNTDETIHYLGFHRFTYYNGLPVISDFFDKSMVSPQYLEAFATLSPGMQGIYVTGTRLFPQNHPHNEEEMTLVYETDSGELYLQTFHFVLDEEFNTNLEYSILLESIPEGLGTAQYSIKEIRQMVEEKLTLDQIQEKISTLSDLILYLKEKDYVLKDRQPMEVSWYNDIQWGTVISPEKIFQQNYTDCGTANLINYILRGDYDEQGYVREVGNETNHIYNYFEQDGVFYFFDFPMFYNEKANYQVFVTEDPDAVGERYTSANREKNITTDPTYIIMAYMFPWDAKLPPIGKTTNLKTPLGYTCFTVLSSKVEDVVHLLYLEDEQYSPIFVEVPFS